MGKALNIPTGQIYDILARENILEHGAVRTGIDLILEQLQKMTFYSICPLDPEYQRHIYHFMVYVSHIPALNYVRVGQIICVCCTLIVIFLHVKSRSLRQLFYFPLYDML